jgi:predicted phosphodiesterase
LGERFNLQSANWISCVLDPDRRIPEIGDPALARDTLSAFLGNIADGLYFQGRSHAGTQDAAALLRDGVRAGRYRHYDELFLKLRAMFAERRWTAVFFPSGMKEHRASDHLLTSRDFVRRLSQGLRENPHLILHLKEPPQKDFAITDIYPPFETALSNCTRWPGVLLWRRSDEPLFFPLPPDRTEAAVRRIFSLDDSIADTPGYLLLHRYFEAFPTCRIHAGSRLTLLQLSDTHIGSKKSAERIVRVKNLVREHLDRNRAGSAAVVLLSGDIVQAPEENHIICANDLYCHFRELRSTCRDPIFVLGNHDMRRSGVLRKNRAGISLAPPCHPRVEWIPGYPVGVVCLNSAERGGMARGKISPEQYASVEEELRHPPAGERNPLLVSLLHHHPLQLHRIDPEMRRFHRKTLGSSFRKILGGAYEHVDGLADGQEFLRFCDDNGVKIVLHGHKHIPTAGRIPQDLLRNGPILTFGCGSAVGKNAYLYRKLFDVDYEISYNEIVLDFDTRRLAGSLMAETRFDKALATMKTHHGFVARSELAEFPRPDASSGARKSSSSPRTASSR